MPNDYSRLKLTKRSREKLIEEVARLEAIGDRDNLPRALIRLARCYLEVGCDTMSAFDACHRTAMAAVRLARKTRDQYAIAHGLIIASSPFLGPRRDRSMLERALAICRENLFVELEGWALFSLAIRFRKHYTFDMAEEKFRESDCKIGLANCALSRNIQYGKFSPEGFLLAAELFAHAGDKKWEKRCKKLAVSFAKMNDSEKSEPA